MTHYDYDRSVTGSQIFHSGAELAQALRVEGHGWRLQPAHGWGSLQTFKKQFKKGSASVSIELRVFDDTKPLQHITLDVTYHPEILTVTMESRSGISLTNIERSAFKLAEQALVGHLDTEGNSRYSSTKTSNHTGEDPMNLTAATKTARKVPDDVAATAKAIHAKEIKPVQNDGWFLSLAKVNFDFKIENGSIDMGRFHIVECGVFVNVDHTASMNHEVSPSCMAQGEPNTYELPKGTTISRYSDVSWASGSQREYDAMYKRIGNAAVKGYTALGDYIRTERSGQKTASTREKVIIKVEGRGYRSFRNLQETAKYLTAECKINKVTLWTDPLGFEAPGHEGWDYIHMYWSEGSEYVQSRPISETEQREFERLLKKA
jgi:hypothetical protein